MHIPQARVKVLWRKHFLKDISAARTSEQQEPLDVKRLNDAPRMPLAALQAVPCQTAGSSIILQL